MFMRQSALGIIIPREGDMCRKKLWLGGRGKSHLHTWGRQGWYLKQESLYMGPIYPVIPCMKPVMREDWESLLHALEWGNRISPWIQTAAVEENGPYGLWTNHY